MRLCKYCNKPIAQKDIWNPDNDGNGYHHQCLVDMEFKARDKQIYDEGKMDALEQIRAEIEQFVAVDKADVLQIIDKYTKEQTE